METVNAGRFIQQRFVAEGGTSISMRDMPKGSLAIMMDGEYKGDIVYKESSYHTTSLNHTGVHWESGQGRTVRLLRPGDAVTLIVKP